MKKALFPGTFNPPTLGHLDIIERATKVCDVLYVGIAKNSVKANEIFSVEEKISMLQTITQDIPNVEVVSFTGLVVDFVKENEIDFLIRGLRAFSDFEYEFRMALANRKLSGIETIFLMASGKLSHISSTLIYEIASLGHRLKEFVPDEIEDEIWSKINS